MSRLRWLLIPGFTLFIGLACLLGFQNCGSSHSDENPSVQDQRLAFDLKEWAELSWTMDGEFKLNNDGFLERWMDSNHLGIALFPPLKPSSTSIDISRSPERLSGGWLNFAPGTSMAPAVADLSDTATDNYTVLTVVRNFTLLPGPYSWPSNRLFNLTPANGEQTGQLIVDVYSDTTGVSFYAIVWFDENNYRQYLVKDTSLPIGQGPYAVGIRFSKTGDDLKVYVNGLTSTDPLLTVGSPPNLGLGARQIYIHEVSGGWANWSGHEQADFGIWKSAVSDSQLEMFTRAAYEIWSGTGPGYIDPDGDGDKGEAILFASIAPLMTNCTGCHASAGTRSGVIGMQSPVSSRPWVTVGNGSGSLMVQALRHQSGVQAMPSGQAAWSASDIDKVVQWIDGGAH